MAAADAVREIGVSEVNESDRLDHAALSLAPVTPIYRASCPARGTIVPHKAFAC